MNKLPEPIERYIEAANAQAPKRLAACFNADATVFDEANVRRGREEIEAWVQQTGERYRSVIEPFGMEEADGGQTVRATVRGQFPGSPITLNFHFQLQSGRIQSLEIKP
jgi:ketosteroid isomerase-like protein